MDITATSFAIIIFCVSLIGALIFDWIAHLLDEMEDKDWWKDIEEEEVDDTERTRKQK